MIKSNVNKEIWHGSRRFKIWTLNGSWLQLGCIGKKGGRNMTECCQVSPVFWFTNLKDISPLDSQDSFIKAEIATKTTLQGVHVP